MEITLGIIQHAPNGKSFASNGWTLGLRRTTGYSVVRKEEIKGHVCTAATMPSIVINGGVFKWCHYEFHDDFQYLRLDPLIIYRCVV